MGGAGDQMDHHQCAAGGFQTPGADGATVTMTVQNIADQLCPGLLALGLTLLMVRLLNKKVNPVWLIFALFGLGIIGNALGFLS